MRTTSCRRRCLAAVVPSQAHRCRSTTDTASTPSTTDSASLTYPQRAAEAELSIGDGAEKEGRLISVSVSIGGHTDSSKWAHADKQADILIGSIFVSGKTKWELLDNIVRRIFKEYVLRVDPVSNVSRSARCAWIPSLTLAGVRAARGSRL
ncbi:PREDICTED: neuron navigator 3-like isoform X2 [Priapulus caudatus]|uniref:Neuron navigator 3-like isoform X2 n=1 Tax=Priapulus caudatus TaxID=37621 RepID=A0ABM1F441_PRICU|nr:PREDICTED: neuron navigator 3-like isoform X2 [Priapulus caudatus]XP_014679213.1 PREDICTED: neuron navigator 3-like isoform X2 [Priapulus caudatus]